MLPTDSHESTQESMLRRVTMLGCMRLSSEKEEEAIPVQQKKVFDICVQLGSALNINGEILLVGHDFLLIMEGEKESLALVLYRMKKYDCIERMDLLTNHDIEEKSYEKWSMKDLSEVRESRPKYTDKVQKNIIANLLQQNTETEFRVATFFAQTENPKFIAVEQAGHNEEINMQEPAVGSDSISEEVDDEKTYYLSSWPKPTDLDPAPELFKLCACMVGKPRTYHSLLAMNICASEEVLQNYLQTFEKLGLLKTDSLRDADGAGMRKIAERKKVQDHTIESASHTFSDELRRFIANAEK